MASHDFIYCKLGKQNDLYFNMTYFKQNELESYKCSILGECLKNKETLLSQYIKRKKAYLFRVMLERELSELSHQEIILSHKHSELLKKWQAYKEERESKDKNRELKKVSLHEDNLGLKIEPVGNITLSKDDIAVLFVFKNIHESKPEEMCSFNLIVTKSGLYKAVDCHPTITELNELILKLNNTNDLHNFIINIRKKFYDYLSKQ